jgi:hypothetical protein
MLKRVKFVKIKLDSVSFVWECDIGTKILKS